MPRLAPEGASSVAGGMRRVMLLMTSRTYRAGAFLKAGESLGIPIVIGTEAETPLMAGERGLKLDFGDPDQAAADILAFSQTAPIAAIIPAEDDETWLAAESARRLGLAHNPPEAAAASRDKAQLRERLRSAGLPTPQGLRIDLDADPEEMAEALSYPLVIKPRFLSGSQGVLRVNGPAEFVAGFQRVRHLLRQPNLRRLGGALADSLWCEAYIPGEEIAVEGLLTGGKLQVLAIFDKPDPLEGPTFEETIYVTPSRQPVSDQVRAVQAVEGALQALGLRHGPVHAELRLNSDGAWLIDLAPRSIGGLCARSLRFEGGESLESLILRQALGEDVTQAKRESQASGVMMIPIPRAGRLEAIEGQEAAAAVRGIEGVVISLPIGERVVPLPEGDRYLGFIFARADAPKQVETSLRQAHGCLNLRIR
jgi:biotin carboxylase